MTQHTYTSWWCVRFYGIYRFHNQSFIRVFKTEVFWFRYMSVSMIWELSIPIYSVLNTNGELFLRLTICARTACGWNKRYKGFPILFDKRIKSYVGALFFCVLSILLLTQPRVKIIICLLVLSCLIARNISIAIGMFTGIVFQMCDESFMVLEHG